MGGDHIHVISQTTMLGCEATSTIDESRWSCTTSARADSIGSSMDMGSQLGGCRVSQESTCSGLSRILPMINRFLTKETLKLRATLYAPGLQLELEVFIKLENSS